jgi:hypothetical protein
LSIEATLICDGCCALIDAGKTAARVRAAAKAQGARVGLPGGRDLCASCAERPDPAFPKGTVLKAPGASASTIVGGLPRRPRR